MNIQLDKLTLNNFKGARSLAVDFTNTTNIFGDNGTFKSTLFDAFTWLLFGKDSHDSTGFTIKTQDPSGAAIPKLEHSVEGSMTVDGAIVTVKRVYQEKWTRRRGSEVSELTGHETLYYWNEVPLQAGEYKGKIDSIVSEGLFKLLTSALYFNSLKWQDRRRALILIAGTITNLPIFATMKKSQVAEITAILESGKDLAQFRKEVAMRKKKLTDDIKLIPSRVDECHKSIPETPDFDKINASIIKVEATIQEIDTAINDKVSTYQEQGEKILVVQSQIFALKHARQLIEDKSDVLIRKENSEREYQLNDLEAKTALFAKEYPAMQAELADLLRTYEVTEKDVSLLREDYLKTQKEELQWQQNMVCPTCKRELDAEALEQEVEKIRNRFVQNQTDRLGAINDEGMRLVKNLEKALKVINGLTVKIEDRNAFGIELAVKLEAVKARGLTPFPALTDIPGYSDLTAQIDALEIQISEAPKINVDGMVAEKAVYQAKLMELKIFMGVKVMIEKGEARITELLAEEKSLAQQISDLEKKEFAMDGYTRAWMDLVETNVNSRFTVVRFRMFSTLINGGTEEACDCLVNGVPYADVNSAGKIQAGIDIINTLSAHYSTYCPIWVDNRESTNVIPATKSQVINLIVSKDKSLIIN